MSWTEGVAGRVLRGPASSCQSVPAPMSRVAVWRFRAWYTRAESCLDSHGRGSEGGLLHRIAGFSPRRSKVDRFSPGLQLSFGWGTTLRAKTLPASGPGRLTAEKLPGFHPGPPDWGDVRHR